MTKNVTLALLFFLSCCLFGSESTAQTVHVVIQPGVNGIDYETNPPLDFRRNGTLLSGTIPLSTGESLQANAESGFSSPLDAVALMNWLTKSGSFQKVRDLVQGTLKKEDEALISDEILNQSKAFMQKITDIEPIVSIQSKDKKGLWIYYRLKGGGQEVVYVDYVKQEGKLFYPAAGDLADDTEANLLILALVHEFTRKVNCYKITQE